MNEYLEDFKNRRRHSKKNIKYNFKLNIKSIISKFLLAIIFFLVSLIFTNMSDDNLKLYKENVFSTSIPFMQIKSFYEKLFGSVLPNEKATTVFSGKLIYKDIKDYYEGEVLTVNNNTLVNNLASGVVVYVGEKDNYNNTVIIQGVDGYDIWYGNLNNTSVNLYDYIEKDSILGETNGDKFYLVIKKGNEYVKYEDYQNK